MSSHLEQLHRSPAHNYFGHHGGPPSQHATVASESLHCIAGRGIVGDRFYDYRPNYAGQITFFSAEVLDELCRHFRLPQADPAALRRNVITRGIDLSELVDQDFCLQGMWFSGASECKPCHWMDDALAAGAEAWLRGRGGLRARILTDGVLRLGEANYFPSKFCNACQSA